MGPTEIQDARRPRQPRHELAPADVHGEQHVADGHPATELLGVGQRLGDAVAGELTVRQLLDVVRLAAGVRLAVEDDIEGQPDRLLGRQVAERDRGDEAVKDPIGPLLQYAGRHRTIVVRTRSTPGAAPREARAGPECPTP